MPHARLTRASLTESLESLRSRDSDVARVLDAHGPPTTRRRPHGFDTLLRIVVGQQLSTKAAATICGRVQRAMGDASTPESLLRLRKTTLQNAGLSRQKIEYVRGLARALESGELNLRAMSKQTDQQVVEAITALKGFGIWSAQMYLIFALRRPDVWPRDDLGVRVGVQRIKQLAERPTADETHALAEPWAPHRSAMALLAWHVCSATPAQQD